MPNWVNVPITEPEFHITHHLLCNKALYRGTKVPPKGSQGLSGAFRAPSRFLKGFQGPSKALRGLSEFLMDSQRLSESLRVSQELSDPKGVSEGSQGLSESPQKS